MKKKDSRAVAQGVIQFKINALKNLKKNITKSFQKIVDVILSCKDGKIIISGVGKSGIIGKKWAATLSSTGSPSFFMDATNASHGDMGQIRSKDVVILISNSGQSEELKNIIKYVTRNKNIKLIGVTSKKNSILYRNSDVAFLMPNIKEAGLENIVPTSSTTAQLALGDAIAITCMKVKNFTKFDFKKIHPSGTLSIKLKTVGDLMTKRNKLPIVKENINMKKAIKVINNKNLGVLIIVRDSGLTSGLLTDGDIKRIAQKHSDFESLELRKVMKKNPISVNENMLATSALSLMNSKKITSLCVHKKNKMNRTIGLVHMHDILNSNIN